MTQVSPKPKLVINLFPSFVSSSGCAFYDCNAGKIKEKEFGPHRANFSEMDTDALRSTDRGIATFLEQSVLVRRQTALPPANTPPPHSCTNNTSQPVAIQTNAIVIIHNDACSLAKAFGSLCEVRIYPGDDPAPIRTGALDT